MTFPNDLPVHPHKAPEWLSDIACGADMVSSRLSNRTTAPVQEGDKQAAVLLLFSGDAAATTLPDDAGILLTHRTPTMRTHSGQMAFPGGRIDPEDLGPVDAALREAKEETGLDPATVTPVATLDTVSVRSNGYPVHPVVAYQHEPAPTWPASEFETDDVFEAHVHELLDETNRITVGWRQWTGPAFRINGYLVWGFTAALLDGLFSAVGWEKHWAHERVYDLGDALAQSRNGERHR
ncbi:NUDIX hydrolase [Corynebacterium cystitidis]|uniref:NUDIX domain-containing protein n=1 Tax=Corynebacterium cystitidis DSM 20524 TaxID=1121357 RepID=A0A1H9UAQ5_9CORY|nr:CoA pyrophosphatase [Corynebacterium cystitidis]WJY81259.1 putative NUDIX hydrolase [Corynebacterium cystitidis DSM 20524]SES06328.1 NUDIX domain-containing protein [Corynebacterium cystitidis DSM 20524]SNV88877.1 NTP pyrophosphohydrolase [Corynebacterium cystitidis]